VLTVDVHERAILTRVLDGALDVRLATEDGAAPKRVGESCLSCRELRLLLELTDSAPPQLQGWRRGPGPGHGPGVVMYRPEEIASMLEAEARLYERAAEVLLDSHAEQGQGAHLRRLAKGVLRAVWRVRRLAPGDVDAATALVEAIRHECRTSARRARRGLWEDNLAHLELIAEFVVEYLLPLRVDTEYGTTSGPRSECEVHRRWMAGAVDLREVVRDIARQQAMLGA
jgi:hypothetical protein